MSEPTTPREALTESLIEIDLRHHHTAYLGHLPETIDAILHTLAPFMRTPGTTEVCENHVYKECFNHGGAMRFGKCKVKPCPLRKETP